MRRVRLSLAVAALAAFFVVAVTAGGADTFTVRLVSQTSSTITLGWDPQPGYGYLFSAGGVQVSRTNDASKSTVKFSKVPSGQYDVDVLAKGANGHYPAAAPPPPPPAGSITQTIAAGSTLSGTVPWRAVYDANGDGTEDDPGSVSFLVDGVQVLNETNPPFGDTAGFWSSATVVDGNHSFRVNALNDAGTVVASNTVTATVSNAAPPPPPPGTCAVSTPNVPDGPDGLGGCFAGPSNTGPDAAADWPGQFTAKGQPGCTLPIQSNTTYRFCDFGSIAVGSSGAPVNNVTFHGCRFKTVAVEDANLVVYGADGGSGITFEYVEIAPGVSAPPTPYNQSYQYGIVADGAYGSFVGRLTVDHSDIWGFGNAIVVEGSTQANPHVFTANYVHDAAQDGGSYHTDGIGDLSDSGVGSYVVLDHNTIISVGNTNGIAFQRGVYDHFTVTRNLLSGFGFTTAIWASLGSTSITFTDNTYSTVLRPYFGPLYPQSFWTTSGSLWKRNRWAVPPGAAWGNTAHNGWYWLPNTSTIDGQSTPSDTPFVSTTDYGG